MICTVTENILSTTRHAQALLADLGRSERVRAADEHPALGWRRSGLMRVTGKPDGPALVCPAALATAADGALAALATIAPGADFPANGAMLLGERVRLMGLGRRGRVSPNGSCRLIEAADGRIALSLAREDDWSLMPAWLEADISGWEAVEAAIASRPARELVERGIELGLPIAIDLPPRPARPWFEASEPVATRHHGRPFVVDLAPLWAGPLAASLLGMAGGRVVKVESVRRPDGARQGHAGFFDLLNGGKESVAVDFATSEGRDALRRLIDRADIVIEGSRPRALAQLGLDAEASVANGTLWISITGHGRTGAAADRVGFGDDAAVAAGLSSAMATGWGEPLFAGDAIADPLTGLHAALAAWAMWRSGEARLVSLSLSGTVAHSISAGLAQDAVLRAWQRMADADGAPLYPPRPVIARARPLGADTASVLGEC